jgi:hypothetical protein
VAGVDKEHFVIFSKNFYEYIPLNNKELVDSIFEPIIPTVKDNFPTSDLISQLW